MSFVVGCLMLFVVAFVDCGVLCLCDVRCLLLVVRRLCVVPRCVSFVVCCVLCGGCCLLAFVVWWLLIDDRCLC